MTEVECLTLKLDALKVQVPLRVASGISDTLRAAGELCSGGEFVCSTEGGGGLSEQSLLAFAAACWSWEAPLTLVHPGDFLQERMSSDVMTVSAYAALGKPLVEAAQFFGCPAIMERVWTTLNVFSDFDTIEALLRICPEAAGRLDPATIAAILAETGTQAMSKRVLAIPSLSTRILEVMFDAQLNQESCVFEPRDLRFGDDVRKNALEVWVSAFQWFDVCRRERTREAKVVSILGSALDFACVRLGTAVDADDPAVD